ncbi:MAG: two-component sensor histidine kinase, partial [Klenkia sp.]|nr:two-component sensor histidine kinase [Klenkia sp.]
MRRQITLLVAATTSVVLLAFLVPAATLVSRVAASRALDAGQQQVQVLLPSVALAGLEDVRVAVEVAVASGRRVAVVWTDGVVLGDPTAVPAGPVGTTAAQEESADGTRLVQPVGRADGTATLSVLVPAGDQRAGVTRSWAVLAGLGVLLFLVALLLADRLARSMTRPVRR